jgi:hypothetical protein
MNNLAKMVLLILIFFIYITIAFNKEQVFSYKSEKFNFENNNFTIKSEIEINDSYSLPDWFTFDFNKKKYFYGYIKIINNGDDFIFNLEHLKLKSTDAKLNFYQNSLASHSPFISIENNSSILLHIYAHVVKGNTSKISKNFKLVYEDSKEVLEKINEK